MTTYTATPVTFTRSTDGLTVYINDGSGTTAVTLWDSLKDQVQTEYWREYKVEMVAVAKNVADDGSADHYTFAIKKTNTYNPGTTWQNVQTTWGIYTVDAQGGYPTEVAYSVAHIGPFERLLGVDLNGDGHMGPQNLVQANTDTSGIGFSRDAEGAVYINDVKNGVAKDVYVRTQDVNFETRNTWGDSNNGGGSYTKVIAVASGDPLRFLAQKAYDAEIASHGVTVDSAYEVAVTAAMNFAKTIRAFGEVKTLETNFRAANADFATNGHVFVEDQNDRGSGYWVLKDIKGWNISSGVENNVSHSWQLLKVDASGNAWGYSQWNTPVSWLESYFGQELNNDLATGPAVAFLNGGAKIVKLVDNKPSLDSNGHIEYETNNSGGYKLQAAQLAKDADGYLYFLTAKSGVTDPQQLSDFNFLALDQWNNSVKLDQKNQSNGNTVMALGEKVNDQGEKEYFIYVKNYDTQTVAGSDPIIKVRDWTAYKITLEKDVDHNIIKASLQYGQTTFSKISTEEIDAKIDINGDGIIGRGAPTVVTNNDTAHTPDSGNDVLAKDAEGAFYILSAAQSIGSDSNAVTVNGNAYIQIAVTDWGGNTPNWEQTWGNDVKKAVAVVKNTASNLPTNNNYSAFSGTDQKFYVAIKTVYQGSLNPNWEIRQVGLDGKDTGTSMTVNKISGYENFFGQDLNGDGDVGINLAHLHDVATDNIDVNGNSFTGVTAAYDGDSQFYIKDPDVNGGAAKKIYPTWGGDYTFENGWSNDTQISSTKVIAAAKADDGQSYLLAVKSETKDRATGDVTQSSWEVHKVKPVEVVKAAASISNGGGTASTGSSAGMMYPSAGGGMAVNTNVPDGSLVFDYSGTDRPSSIADYETIFNQDLNHDGKIGVNFDRLTDVRTDTTGVKLARDPDKALYIIQGEGVNKTAKVIGNGSWLEYNNTWTGGFNKREAIAVEELHDSHGTLTGYTLALKNTNSYNMYGTSSANQPTVTWDILQLDTAGKVTYGSYDDATRMWKDSSVYGVKSISQYESAFGQDLNDDGHFGIDISQLTFSALDTSGLRLARDNDKALYIVTGTGSSATAKAIGNAGWIENSYDWGMGSNKKEAVAVEAERDANNNIVSYKLALKQTSTSNGVETVSWDILKLDADAKVTYGSWDSATNMWRDDSVYGTKSIASYEEFFGSDLNGDGVTGIDLASLVQIDTDITGAGLSRDKDKALYVVNGSKVNSISNASWLEYDNSWGYGSNKKQAVAVEAQRDGAGNVTSYKLALKQTDSYNGTENVNWDIQTLTTDFKVDNSGGMASGGSVYTKSIAAYEDLFNQDLNGDGRIGVDVASLTKITMDTSGVTLGRDSERALYIIEGQTAKAIGNSSWLEYNNTWMSGSNQREAVAVEVLRDGNGVATGYALAMKQTNVWSEQTTVTWDVLRLDLTGNIQYGHWDQATNQWVDKTVYGAKSIAPYEVQFGQDLNGDGFIGIDVSTLKMVSTDTQGVRLAKDAANALYIVDGVGAAAVATAVGNASWLEYDNSWSGGSNKMEAVAVEAIRNSSNVITSYKLALKQTNTWNGTADTNWQVLTLDAQGSVNWNMGPSGGNSLWTRKVKLVENLVHEDLNGDGDVGVPLASLSVFNEGTLTTEDGVKIAKDASDGGLYIVNGTALTSLTDSYGSTPDLEYSRAWTGGTSSAQILGATKQILVGGDYQYRVAVKVTTVSGTTTDVAYQIHTISKDGVLDWTKVATVRNTSRFESLFGGQDLDGLAQPVMKTVSTDQGSVVLQIDTTKALYIFDSSAGAPNNGITYIVDAQGGSPAFDVNNSGFKSEAYAIHQYADGSYKLAVKKTITINGTDTIKWEVYTVNARDPSSNEAKIDWAKTAYLKDVRDVETFIKQDIDGDGIKGRDQNAVDVTGDVGTVKAALTADDVLYINNAGTKIAIVDTFGVGINLNKSQTWDSGNSSFTAEVVAAEKVDVTTSGTTVSTFKIAVKETMALQNETPSVTWKIYTASIDGVVNSKPVVSTSIARWEAVLNQDLNGDGVKGIVLSDLTPVATDTSDVSLDKSGAVYVRSGGVFIQVTDGNDGSVSFESDEVQADSSSSSHVIAAETQADGTILMAVEYDSQVGDVATKSWVVHTLNVEGTGSSAYAEIDWTKADVTSDMSSYVSLFGQNFVQDQVTTVGA